jgi:SAM-dependent methyltransferase
MSEPLNSLRWTFDSAADLYDAARPSYPSELFDDLIELAGLEPGDRLLEIGCATGKATRSLLDRGFSIVCVEMGAELAAQARRNLAGLPAEIHVAQFEAWQAEPERFDLVYAAPPGTGSIRRSATARLTSFCGRAATSPSGVPSMPSHPTSTHSSRRSNRSMTRSARATTANGRPPHPTRSPT